MVETMSAKERKLKASLVRTRQVISNKFRKLNRERILQKKELEAKYAPITESMNKLIDSKQQLFDKKKSQNPNLRVKKEEVENRMEVDDDDDDLMTEDEDEDDDLMTFDGANNDDDDDDDSGGQANKEIKPSSKLKGEYFSNVEREHPKPKKERDSFGDHKNSQSGNQYDVVRFYSPGSDDTDDEKTTIQAHRKNLRMEKIMNDARNSFSSNSKFKRTHDYDANRSCEHDKQIPCRKRATEIIPPEDYDKNGTKRRKIERPVKQHVRRKPAPKQKPAFSYITNDFPIITFQTKRKFSKTKPPINCEKNLKCMRDSVFSNRKSNRSYKYDSHRFADDSVQNRKRSTEIISPEDYDSDGNFVGLATKRRKVERPVKQRVTQKPKPKRKPASKKIAANDFIKTLQTPAKTIQTKRKFSKTKPLRNVDKILQSMRNSVQLNRKGNRANENDSSRLIDNETQKRAPKIEASLEDYNEYGKLIGLAPKRRKIQITEKKLSEIQQNRKRMKKRIKYDGEGVEKKFIPYTENIVYEYYDDVNEIVDRLMLLVSSKGAGNTNHDQEINSIIEELRERGVIH